MRPKRRLARQCNMVTQQRDHATRLQNGKVLYEADDA